MGLEVEAKIRLSDDDADALRERLAAQGATLDRTLFETNTYYDTADRGLTAADRGLRLRVEVNQDTGDRRVVLTHKGPSAPGPLKSRIETEAGVNDAAATAAVLAALGYRPTLGFEKRRVRYLLDGCRIEIDQIAFLGTHVEIESTTASDVERVRTRLGLADHPLTRESYVALLDQYVCEHPDSVGEDRVVRLTGAPSARGKVGGGG